MGDPGRGGIARIDDVRSGSGKEIILPYVRRNGGDGSADGHLHLPGRLISQLYARAEAVQVELVVRLRIDQIFIPFNGGGTPGALRDGPVHFITQSVIEDQAAGDFPRILDEEIERITRDGGDSAI